MSRNESKSSQNFTKDQIRQQQNRITKLNDGGYHLDSPDIGTRKLNAKVGVQLAPLGPGGLNQAGQGRASMMSMKNMDEVNEGTESHPILRVQNYKKPQLEKLYHPGGMGEFDMIDAKQSNGSIGLKENNPNIAILNSKKMVGRKRDNAQLAPLHNAPGVNGHLSKMSNN